MLQAHRRATPAVDMTGGQRACRRALEPGQAEAILAALGIRGEVARCWVDCQPGKPRRHAVLAATGERWPGTRVPVERVFYLRHEKGEWYLDASCRVMPNELDAVFDRGPVLKGKTFLESLEEQAFEEAVSAAGIGRGVVPEYSKESAEWYGMHIDRRRGA